jgi:DNA-binding NtrC family response regulator
MFVLIADTQITFPTMSEKPLILVVDDTEDARYALEKLLKHNGYDVIGASDGEQAERLARERSPNVVLLDVMMPLVDGYEVSRRFKADSELKFIPILLVTARDALEDVVKGLDAGADDYISKPFKAEELLARVRAALRLQTLYEELRSTTERNSSLVELVGEKYNFSNIIGESEPMKRLFKLLGKVSQADSPVLITGSSGTGKELVARAVHFNSPRKKEAFIARNCAAFNENLLESELFGHVRGSFTGAIKDQKGVFELADRGTLFLDEVGEMTQSLQAKLLRVLQEGVIVPVGGNQERKVKVRVVAATHRDLPKMIEEGKFREDLFYRLNVVGVELPPLKERREDIPLLIEHFLDRAAKRTGKQRMRFSEEAITLLQRYDWPGNIRELENEIERVLILADEDRPTLGEWLLSDRVRGKSLQKKTYGDIEPPAGAVFETSSLREVLEDVERREIEKALTRYRWNRSKTAKELGISRSNLLSKIESFALQPPADLSAEEEQ